MSPAIHPLGWEAGAKTWCYFCQCEVRKHEVRQGCIVASAALLHHLASSNHARKMHTFFWDNLIPVNRKVDFVICSEDAKRFIERAEQAIKNYLRKEKAKISEEASKIRTAKHQSQVVRWMGIQQQTFKAETKVIKTQMNMKTQDSSDALPAGKKTLSAFGPGLTCIMQSQVMKDWQGNIYSGATPPWLMQEGIEGSKEIGPTAGTFSKHLRSLQKQRLPACRVGATFSHRVDTSTQWLPAFGSVWNSGRRLNSQHQFLKKKSSWKSSCVPVLTNATSVTPVSQFYRGHKGKTVQTGVQSRQDAVTCSGETVRDISCIPAQRHSLKSATTASSILHTTITYTCGQERHEKQPPPPPGPSSSDSSSHTPIACTATPSQYPQPCQQQTATALTASTVKRERESDDLLVCVPYKRQRVVHTAVSALAADLIPVTTRLLSHPAQKNKNLNS